MATYSEHEQRPLDQQSGEEMDRAATLPPVVLPPIREERVDFYMIWTKTGHAPRFIHHSEERAIREAQRLARKHPGKKFIVLAARRKFSAAAAPPKTLPAAAPEAEREAA